MTEEMERAAIIEYLANKPRSVAEKEAQAQQPTQPKWPCRCECSACVGYGRSTVLG